MIIFEIYFSALSEDNRTISNLIKAVFLRIFVV